MKLVTLRTPDDISQIYKYLDDFEIIAYDCETTGLNRDSEVIGLSFCAEEDLAYYMILASWDVTNSELVYAPGMRDAARLFVEYLSKKKLVMHNAVFDCQMAENYFKVPLIRAVHTDTMILAHLLNENRRVGLKDLAVSMFGQAADFEAREVKASVQKNGGSTSKVNYEMYKADPEIMAKYGAQDAALTYKVFIYLVPELYEQGLAEFFYRDESMPLLRGPTYEMNTTGLAVDTTALTQLKKTLQAECQELKSFIYNEIDSHTKLKYPGTNKKNMFNISASQQLSWLLFGELQLEFQTLTKAGKQACKDLGLKLPYSPGAKKQFISACIAAKGTIQIPECKTISKTIRAKKFKDPWAYIACDKATLKTLSSRHKWIAKLLEYNKKMKILSTYIEGIEERIQYGIIRPSFLQHGTTSGRYACRNPNFQNLPRDDKRIKSCIVARRGKTFIGADYSQLEPRVFAYFSNDTRLLEAFRGEDDFYSVIGMEVYGKTDCTPRKEGSEDAFGVKYKKLRDLSKVIALASTYGATAHQLAPTTGKSIQDTQKDIESYFEQFPDVKKFMLDSHNLAKTQGFVENLFGRKRGIPEAKKINMLYGNTEHADLPYEARKLLNLSTNHRIQSTGASIVNRSAIAFYAAKTELALDCKIVSQVHDSLIVECNTQDIEIVKLLLQNSMESTIDLKVITLEAEPKVGDSLAEV